MLTFYNFLIGASKKASVRSPAWADIGLDLARDDNAPRANAPLYVYLKHKFSEDTNMLDTAWREYQDVAR